MTYSLTDVIAEAIEEAHSVPSTRTYGQYDYSQYPGEAEPYVVKAPGQKEVVFQSNDQNAANAFWANAEKRRVSGAVLQAIDQAGYVVVSRDDLRMVVNPPAVMDFAVDQAASDATERLSAMLSASKEG